MHEPHGTPDSHTAPAALSWRALTQCLFDTAKARIEALLDTGAGPLYAVAFHASYREQEASIDMPSLAANGLAQLDDDHPDWRDDAPDFHGVRWNPADWHWDWMPDEYGGEALAALEAALQAHATRGSVAMWDSAERRFLGAVVRAAAALSRHFAHDPRVAPDFVAFFHDHGGGAALAARSMPAGHFARLFPAEQALNEERRRVAALTGAQQAAYYAGRLHAHDRGIDSEEAERALIACGAPALPALIALLRTQRRPSTAARVIGLIGVRDAAAIDALRETLATTQDAPTANWCASALGYLGDTGWLLDRASTPAALEHAVSGCCANLSSFRDRGAQPPRLDYTPLEQLLLRYPHAQALAEEDRAPGRGDAQIHAGDHAELLRALGERLGAAALAPVHAALLDRAAHDDDEGVRRLAALTLESMSRWKLGEH